MLTSLPAVIAPLKYTNSTFCLYSWPAALIVSDTFPPPLVCRHKIYVFASVTVSPNGYIYHIYASIKPIVYLSDTCKTYVTVLRVRGA